MKAFIRWWYQYRLLDLEMRIEELTQLRNRIALKSLKYYKYQPFPKP